jgi:hypothetical protein
MNPPLGLAPEARLIVAPTDFNLEPLPFRGVFVRRFDDEL